MLIRFMTLHCVKAMFIFFIVASLTGCGYAIRNPITKDAGYTIQNPFKKVDVKTQEDIGSIHLAVLSVAPWGEYVKELQPEFKLTTEDALKEIVPTTSILDIKVMDFLGAGFKAALPTSAATETKTATSVTGQDEITEKEIKEERKPGDLSTVSGGTIETPEKDASNIPVAAGEVSIDPMTKYLAATALYQEVKLLNKYIKDAAVYDYDGVKFDSYVVRLQISLMPRRRDLEYDVYANFSFFTEKELPKLNISEPIAPQPKTSEKIVLLTTAPQPETSENNKINVIWPDCKDCKAPIVIPLLVTDNIENMLSSRAEDKLRQYALALSAMVQNIGIGASFNRVVERLESERGNYLNSLLTVAKVSENTLRVRLGAMKQTGAGGGKYAMVPRTHNITVLLMVPEGSKAVGFIAKTSMIDAKSGKDIPPRSFEQTSEAVKNIRDAFEVGKHDISGLFSFANENQWGDFIELCKKNFPGNKSMYCNSVWLELSSLLVGAPYGATKFGLPFQPAPELFPKQMVFLLDDTKEKTIVRLKGGKNLQKEYLSATLYLDRAKAEVKGLEKSDVNKECANIENHYPFIAESIELTSEGKTADFVFPSLTAWGFGKEWGAKTGNNKLEIKYSKDKAICLEKTFFESKPKAR